MNELNKRLPLEERLLQLAEECSELSKACLKARRAITKTNPTPKSTLECFQEITEEAADVLLCMHACGIAPDSEKLTGVAMLDTAIYKYHRWIQRLDEEATKNEQL